MSALSTANGESLSVDNVELAAFSNTYQSSGLTSVHLPIVLKAMEYALQNHKSDIRFIVGQPPWFRRGGEYGPESEGFQALSQPEIENLVRWVDPRGMYWSSRAICHPDRVRWRATSSVSAKGAEVSLRNIPDEPLGLSQLNLPSNAFDCLRLRQGLIVVSGATGSGKTNTLAAFIKAIAEEQSRAIITIEDPIEFIYSSAKSSITQWELGTMVPDMETAFHIALRSTPEIILVGECRSPAEIQSCLLAADTGHLVFTTVHARDCASTIARMCAGSGDDARERLAQVLKYTISQQLLPDRNDLTVRHLAAEVVEIDHALIQEIAPGGDLVNIYNKVRDKRVSMDNTLSEMVYRGTISEDVALGATIRKAEYLNFLSSVGARMKHREQQVEAEVQQRRRTQI